LYRIGSRDSRVRDRHTQLTQPVVRAWQSGRGSTAHYAVAYNGTTPHTIHKVYQLGYWTGTVQYNMHLHTPPTQYEAPPPPMHKDRESERVRQTQYIRIGVLFFLRANYTSLTQKGFTQIKHKILTTIDNIPNLDHYLLIILCIYTY